MLRIRSTNDGILLIPKSSALRADSSFSFKLFPEESALGAGLSWAAVSCTASAFPEPGCSEGGTEISTSWSPVFTLS